MTFTHPCFLCWACGPSDDCGCQPSNRIKNRMSGYPSAMQAAPSISDTPSAPTTPPMSPAAPPIISGTTTNAPMSHRMNPMSASPTGAQHGT